MMPRVHLEDDKTVDVDPDAIEFGEGEQPDGYVPVDRLESEVDEKTQKARKAAKEKTKRKLRQDEEFLREAASERFGLVFDEDGELVTEEVVDTSEIREKVANRLEQDKVKPLEQQLEEKDQKLSALLQRDKRGTILEAANAAGVDDMYLQAPTEGAPPTVVQMFGDSFGYDEESGQWVVKDGDGGFRYSSNEEGGTGYMTAKEFFQRLQSDETYKGRLFKDTRKNGSGLQQEGGGRSGDGQVTSKADLGSSQAKAHFIRDHSLEEYEALPDE